MQFVEFFFGTPKRFLTTLVVLFLIWCAFNMDAVESFLTRLFNVIMNGVLPNVIIILCILYGFKLILNGFGNRKK